MDAYDVQERLKQAWSTIAMQQSQTGNLTKSWPSIPVVVKTEGLEKIVVDVVVKDNRIYLELK